MFSFLSYSYFGLVFYFFDEYVKIFFFVRFSEYFWFFSWMSLLWRIKSFERFVYYSSNKSWLMSCSSMCWRGNRQFTKKGNATFNLHRVLSIFRLPHPLLSHFLRTIYFLQYTWLHITELSLKSGSNWGSTVIDREVHGTAF